MLSIITVSVANKSFVLGVIILSVIILSVANKPFMLRVYAEYHHGKCCK